MLQVDWFNQTMVWPQSKSGKKSCFCSIYLKKGICSHNLAYSYLLNLNWFGLGYSGKPTKFFNKTKRGRKSGREAKAKIALKM